jgi:hypothetical protein
MREASHSASASPRAQGQCASPGAPQVRQAPQAPPPARRAGGLRAAAGGAAAAPGLGRGATALTSMLSVKASLREARLVMYTTLGVLRWKSWMVADSSPVRRPPPPAASPPPPGPSANRLRPAAAAPPAKATASCESSWVGGPPALPSSAPGSERAQTDRRRRWVGGRGLGLALAVVPVALRTTRWAAGPAGVPGRMSCRNADCLSVPRSGLSPVAPTPMPPRMVKLGSPRCARRAM